MPCCISPCRGQSDCQTLTDARSLQVRAVLDAAGGKAVKVIPCNDAMLYEPMSTVVGLPEPDWEQPRPEGWTRGGAWGSQRTILFSGMKYVSCNSLTRQPYAQ